MINFYDSYLILSKVFSDGAYIKQSVNETPIEQINKPYTIKICYGVLDKNVELDYYIKRLCEKSPKLKIKILLKIGFYAIKYLKNKPFAVTDSLVELTKKLGKGANAGFINATMRAFIASDIPLPTEKIEHLSVKYSFPEFAVKRLIEFYGEEKAESIMAFDSEYTFVRFNCGVDGEKYLTEKGLNYEKTPFYNLYSVPNMKMNEDFYNGIYTFQSIGSVAICQAVGTGKRFLDACAAPGGKSVLLADSFESVTALELHEHRCELINSYVDRMKKTNVTVICHDSTKFDLSLGKFDAVLCDVPCSGFGTFKNNPDVKINKSESIFSGLNKTQLDILLASANYLNVGGKLVYSTCSFFDDENDKIVEKFLSCNDDFAALQIVSPLNNVKKNYGLQFLPDISFGAGFYVSVMKKIK